MLSGAQQGIDIISKVMVHYGDVVFVEKPTFYGAAGAFLSRGAKLVEVPLEDDGMDMVMLEDYLKLYQPKFIYMMAYFQAPTGISYSMEKNANCWNWQKNMIHISLRKITSVISITVRKISCL